MYLHTYSLTLGKCRSLRYTCTEIHYFTKCMFATSNKNRNYIDTSWVCGHSRIVQFNIIKICRKSIKPTAATITQKTKPFVQPKVFYKMFTLVCANQKCIFMVYFLFVSLAQTEKLTYTQMHEQFEPLL